MNQSRPVPAIRPSACPGLWRIVQALDGGISRIKLDAGHLEADQAEALATAAERFAGGVIEVTNRSNLQIRGVGDDHQGLVAQLLGAGLGPQEAAGDDVRNLMLSPAAGFDPAMLFDTRALGARILDLLQTTPRFHELSAKFAVQLDGGEDLAMLWHPHDLWLSPLHLDDQLWLAFGLAGCPGHDAPLGAVPLEQGLALVHAVLARFLDLADAGQSRMRQLLAAVGVDSFLAGLPLSVRRDAAVLGWRRHGRDLAQHLGVYPQLQAGRVAVGAMAPLGRLSARQLRGVAALARELGDGSLRMTPWQSVLLPNVAVAQAERVLAGLACLGLIVDAAAPLAGVVACTGSAGCAKAQADTKADAVQLAARLRRRGPVAGIHLSGCNRSCAMAHTAPSTLLAVGPGRYDLYFHDPAQPGPGALAGRNLTLEEAGATLDARHGAPSMIDYIRDGQEIYRNSFAIIRQEARLERIPPDLEKLAVRVIHACGMVEVVDRLQFSEGAGKAGREALAAGAPILCDARMVAEGITRARLPANNEVICTLRDESVPDLAKELGNTRSAVALELWRPYLEGSVVVIGNAPTALFYLLEMIDAGAPKPALILGFPVGFVGAAESKAMLAADSRGVPFVIVEGRLGGSAMAAAAVNALATEVE